MFLRMAQMWAVVSASLSTDSEYSSYNTADIETKILAYASYIFFGIALGMMITYCILDKIETIKADDRYHKEFEYTS